MNLSQLSQGKVPPQATDIEKAVLGFCMLQSDAFDEVCSILTVDSFYNDNHKRIFKAMANISNRGGKIDILTVVEELKSLGELELIGGAYYVTSLDKVLTGVESVRLEQYCRIIQEKYIGRELITLGVTTAAEGYDETVDVFDLLEKVDKKLTDISNGTNKSSTIHIGDNIPELLLKIDEQRIEQKPITGVPSGYKELDRNTCGWQPTDLIILAARPSVGKTAFALNLARNAARNEIKSVPVLIFSLEMGAKQLVQRMLSSESGISIESIRTGRVEEYQMNQLFKNGMEQLGKMPIYIDDTAALSLFELRSKARKMVRRKGIGMIIIDYLQLMSGDSKSMSREQEISVISRGLKGLAKELNIPVIALSQLSRKVEERKDDKKMPQLSDLRESGAIEQDADVVMFLYRPEYYGQNTNEWGESTSGETHLKIAKHRNGSLDTIQLKALLHIQKFVDSDASLPTPQELKTAGWKRVSDITSVGDF